MHQALMNFDCSDIRLTYPAVYSSSGTPASAETSQANALSGIPAFRIVPSQRLRAYGRSRRDWAISGSRRLTLTLFPISV